MEWSSWVALETMPGPSSRPHTELQVCKDMESFLVAVVKNTKVDPRADANPCSRLDQLVLEVVGVDGARRSRCVPPQRDLDSAIHS